MYTSIRLHVLEDWGAHDRQGLRERVSPRSHQQLIVLLSTKYNDNTWRVSINYTYYTYMCTCMYTNNLHCTCTCITLMFSQTGLGSKLEVCRLDCRPNNYTVINSEPLTCKYRHKTEQTLHCSCASILTGSLEGPRTICQLQNHSPGYKNTITVLDTL